MSMLSLPANSSVTSLAKSQSVRSTRTITSPPNIKTVVTAPPWARDEPPSPKEEEFLVVPSDDHRSESRPSDVVSFQSSADAGPSRWWSFNRSRFPRNGFLDNEALSDVKYDLKGQLSRPWNVPSPVQEFRQPKEQDESAFSAEPWDLRVKLPPPPDPAAFTVSHTQTPGWDSPWTARPPVDGFRDRSHYSMMGEDLAESHKDEEVPPNSWRKTKKKLRGYLLTNPYVPLLFRVINITLTSSALGIAIRIRTFEKRNQVMGAVGASPTLAIIFAPLTLVHVMIAIYLEYFGRPLGLWHTSGKLAHTLSETLFICAWSATLSLCFDNYFTSIIPCAREGTRWYNEIPAPPDIPGLGRWEGGVGDRICDYQVALISTVGVGLIMYCMNLIISLYRIFEKVKYHPASSSLHH